MGENIRGRSFPTDCPIELRFDQFQWNSQFKAELTECHLYVMQIGNVGSPNVLQQGGGGIYQVRVEMRGGYFNELSLCNRDFRTPSGWPRKTI